jgi:two-component system, chemotaxis family, CheB/CheR fusion protein
VYIVGIGASSGGLQALQVLLGSLPPRPGFACVIVMHLSPDHESHLPRLLQQYTPLPVTQVNTTIAVEANHIYVIPPNANLNTIDTHLRLSELEERRIERAPIDHFLKTLAATHDGTAIGVILTGAGSDGSIGLRYVRECGGLTIVQDPQEAEYDSMPRSAVATGVVDLVLPLHRIANEIQKFCETQPELPHLDPDGRLPEQADTLLRQITSDLERNTRQSFSVYRRAKMLKRVRRRMQLQHVTDVRDYLDILGRKNQEATALAEDLVLVPTEFFGDLDTFRELEQHIIPCLLERTSSSDARVRVWNIGCSTGEEAYSLAMLFTEALQQRQQPARLQIFATDNSPRSLASAREGIYPREIGAAVSPERLERFFTAERGSFRVKREIRDGVLFASHNLFRDPPFAHIDLIVCRHLLGELQPEVRRAVLSLFHYSLEPEGLLFLGGHDDSDIEGFEAVRSVGGHLFRRTAGPAQRYELPSSLHSVESQPIRPKRPASSASARTDVSEQYRAALESYAPPSVLINLNNEVVHFSTTASRYLRIPGGEFTRDLTRLVPDAIRNALLPGLRELRAGSASWDSDVLPVDAELGSRCIRLHAERVTPTELILVMFDDRDRIPALSDATHIIADLESQIGSLNARLQDLTQGTQVHDPNSARNLLHVADEELRSALEELADSREELQAVNEELITLDAENRRRIVELTQLSTDLQHLLASTGVATLFLDRELHIVRFTPLLGELLSLRTSDVGRHVSDLARLARDQNLEQDAGEVLRSQRSADREARHADGRWFLRRLLPHQTESGRVEGVVLTLMDITARKRAELALQDSSRNTNEFLVVLAHELRNPLAPISAGVEVLKAAPGDRRLVEKVAATLGRQTQHLVRLVDDLLEVSRLHGGELQLRTAVIDFREVILDAIAAAKPSMAAAGHVLAVEISEEPLWIVGDSARLIQMVSNLLNNSVRVTPNPGKITVRARARGPDALLSVADTGVGLGIGLTLARSLIELQGGRITVSSAGEDLGSEFEVCLPLATPALRPVEPSKETDPVSSIHASLNINECDDDAIDPALGHTVW